MTPDKPVSEAWSALPVQTRRALFQAVIQKARDAAATSIMVQSQGGENDIIKQATEAKQAQLPLQTA